MDESSVGGSANSESVVQENAQENVEIDDVVKKIESVSSDDGSADEEAGGTVDDLDKFRQALRSKRQSVVLELKTKIDTLRQQLTLEKDINEQLRRQKQCCNCSTAGQQLQDKTSTEDSPDNEPELDDNHHHSSSSSNVALKSELADVQLSLQLANAEILSLTSELRATQRQVSSLKEVIVFSKQMVEIRENQLSQVRNKFVFLIYCFHNVLFCFS